MGAIKLEKLAQSAPEHAGDLEELVSLQRLLLALFDALVHRAGESKLPGKLARGLLTALDA